MASIDGDDGSEELSFLDLNNCSQETRSYLLGLIEDESKKPTPAQPPAPVTTIEAKSSVPQAQHHYQQQVYATPPTSQPYVYINQVTANVNVHHGAEQMKSMLHHPGPPVATNHSGFPPPPPNPMTFSSPVVSAAANPAGILTNGTAAGAFLPPQSHGQYIYQHPIAAMAAKPGPPQGQPLYMPPHHVVYYPFPIPVSQHAAPTPQATPRPPPPVIRNSPTNFSQPMAMVTTANEAFYPSTPSQPQHIPNVKEEPVEPPAAVEKSIAETVEVEQNVPEVEAKEDPSTATLEEEEPQPAPTATTEAPSEKTPSESSKKDDEDAAAAMGGNGSKSWASLFHKDSPVAGNHVGNVNKPIAKIQPYTNVAGENASRIGGAKPDSRKKDDNAENVNAERHPDDVAMAKYLQAYSLSHRSSMIKPRGLSNRNNWCFVNAILQALVACPPFYNLMKSLPLEVMKKAHMVKITKVVQAFVSEFAPLDHFPKLKWRDKGKKNEDLPLGMTFEASAIFQFLLNLSSDTFKVEDGRQEDAEEFLTFLLNELNDEMLGLLKLLVSETDEEEEQQDDDDNDEWHEVGARNKSLLTRRVGHSNESLRSPVASIFQGQLQSCVQSSNGEPTATLQPFFTLPLDIQSKNIKNVSDALIHNFTAETIDGYMCSKTNKQIEASRSLYLDELPSVLVLHLKRFIYDETSSAGCQKLLKNIDFPVDLEIPKDILSNNSKNKYHNKQRSYKLFAVVYHNGKEASLGHYVTDVYHAGLGWLHCDDSLIKSMSETMVLAHSANSVPYILFYRRGDTMGPGPNASSSVPISSSTSSSSTASSVTQSSK